MNRSKSTTKPQHKQTKTLPATKPSKTLSKKSTKGKKFVIKQPKRSLATNNTNITLSQSPLQQQQQQSVTSRRFFSSAIPPTTSVPAEEISTSTPPHAVSNQSPASQQGTSHLIEHVFFKVETANNLFYNAITVSFPDHTPQFIVTEATKALQTAFKDRPDAQNYAQNRLRAPEFNQFGANWNRYEWSVRQREIDGALDPLLIQTVILDHFQNYLSARYISSNSSSWFNRDTVTHVLQFPVDAVDYIGTYRDTIYDQDGKCV